MCISYLIHLREFENSIFLKGNCETLCIFLYNRMEHLVVVNPMFIEDLVAAGIPREK